MTLEQYAGLPYLETPADTYYGTVIRKLGGLAVIRPYIPFPDDVLKDAYNENEYFNTKKTPLSKWDAATGIFVPQNGYGKTAYGPGLVNLLREHSILCVSLSECVCILKTAAKYAMSGEPLPNKTPAD